VYTFPAPSDKYTPPPPGGRQVCGRRAVIVLTPPSPNLHLTVTNQCIFKINDLPGAPRGSVLEPRTTDLAPKGPHNLRSKETHQINLICRLDFFHKDCTARSPASAGPKRLAAADPKT
jgi:hypothetical protein